ncbi:MAG: hypothetical protein ACKOXQ_07140 [Hydrogenophaga sp.]
MSPSSVTRSLIAAAVAWCVCMPLWAQERIYRCGHEYTNDAARAQRPGCQAVSDRPLTFVQGVSSRTEAPTPSAPRRAGAPATGGGRVDPAQQRARDSDARTILEAELRQALDRLARAEQAYANGQPEQEGGEARNHQRYLDRVDGLRSALVRAQNDVQSIRRELGRLGAAPGAAATGAP